MRSLMVGCDMESRVPALVRLPDSMTATKMRKSLICMNPPTDDGETIHLDQACERAIRSTKSAMMRLISTSLGV